MPQKSYFAQEVKGPVYYHRHTVKTAQNMSVAHYHNCSEIYYLVEGERNYLIDNKLYYVHSGDLILIPTDVLHRTAEFSRAGHERILIEIQDDWISPEVKCCFENHCYHIPPKNQDELIALFNAIGTEYALGDEFSQRIVKDKVHELLVFLLRLSKAHPMIKNSDLHDDRIENAVQYIGEHYAEPLTLKSIADRFFISREYFSTIFKKKTGFGFNEYLNQVRISQARKLLENQKLTVTQTAYRCGYSDSAYFAVVFKRVCGIPPKKYQTLNNAQFTQKKD